MKKKDKESEELERDLIYKKVFLVILGQGGRHKSEGLHTMSLFIFFFQKNAIEQSSRFEQN